MNKKNNEIVEITMNLRTINRNIDAVANFLVFNGKRKKLKVQRLQILGNKGPALL